MTDAQVPISYFGGSFAVRLPPANRHNMSRTPFLIVFLWQVQNLLSLATSESRGKISVYIRYQMYHVAGGVIFCFSKTNLWQCVFETVASIILQL